MYIFFFFSSNCNAADESPTSQACSLKTPTQKEGGKQKSQATCMLGSCSRVWWTRGSKTASGSCSKHIYLCEKYVGWWSLILVKV